jgi:hypothetical protein
MRQNGEAGTRTEGDEGLERLGRRTAMAGGIAVRLEGGERTVAHAERPPELRQDHGGCSRGDGVRFRQHRRRFHGQDD